MQRFLAALALAVCTVASAAMVPDPTGLWWVPEESGWGMSLVQQQDTVVAVLFVYDDAQRPTWYVATTTGTFHLDPTNEQVFSGTLYRTSGPWFGGAFDPRAVSATAVGSLQMVYVRIPGGKNIALSYTVNGVAVSKTVQPQTWGNATATLTGSYSGGFAFPALPTAGCNLLTDLFRQPTAFSVSNTSGELHIVWGTGIDTFCDAHGPYVQRGLLGRMDGTLSCQPVGFPLSTSMTITLADIAANANGFNATADIRRLDCVYSGRFGGVRQP